MKSWTTFLLGAALLAAISFSAPTALVAQEAADTAAERKKQEGRNLPLEEGRTVSLDTDVGTWLSLDVSPDGGTVVFGILGDLYTVPLDGGDATRITAGMAYDTQPRYNPDGTQLVFISDRSGGDNLWTLDLATGDTTQVTTGNGSAWMSPDWTPDGDYIVASKGATRLGVVQLWMGHVDGGSGRFLREEPAQLKTVGAAVSPDGRYVWHAQRMSSFVYNAQLPQYQLAAYDRETGETFTRTSRYGSAFRPTLSPDGASLVYGSRYEDQTGLRIRDLATGDERWLAYPVQRDDQESIADRDVYPGMSFTPDSREVVASYDGRIWRIPLDGSDPIGVPFRVREQIAVGPLVEFDYPVEDTPTFTVRQIRDAVASPDGSRLAFTSLDKLYVMDFPGGEPERLDESDMVQAFPSWSPDGRWLAYATWGPDGGQIMRTRSDGGGSPEQLTTATAQYQQVTYSGRGGRIVALRNPTRAFQETDGTSAGGAEMDIVWIPSEGGAATVIAPAEGRQTPHFVDGSPRIYLHHGSAGLVSIRFDGTDEEAHVKVVGNTRPGSTQPNGASELRMAPRGDLALAKVNDDVYVVTVPQVGGDTPQISVSNPADAAFPAWKLTDIGGDFPSWSADGRSVHYSIGNAHFVYDLDAAEAFAEAEEAADEEEGEADAPEEGEADEPEEIRYEPLEQRILIQADRDMPEGVVVLRGARALTMNGREVIEDSEIVVRNNRIEAVGLRGSVSIPPGADVIDLSGQTIVPGFVDTHAHIRSGFGLHKTQSWMFLANLAYGVTTTRDPQTATTDVLTYADRVRTGDMIGPRMYSTGPGIFGDYVEEPIRDLDHARDIMRRYSEYYDTKTIKMYMAGNRQQRQWVIMAARENRIMPTIEGGLMFKYDMTVTIDGYPGTEHSLPIAPLFSDVVDLMAATKIAYTPTLLVSYGGPWAENYYYSRENPHDDPKLQYFTAHGELDQKSRRRPGWFRDEEHVFQKHALGTRQLVEAGGRVGVGSHGQLQGLGYHWELWSVAAGGMDEYDAIRTATILGAEAIGLDEDLGSIEAGKLADLVILSGNPLDDLRNTNTITHVMMNGRFYEGNTLNETWPRQKTLERFDWVGVEPPNTRAGIGR